MSQHVSLEMEIINTFRRQGRKDFTRGEGGGEVGEEEGRRERREGVRKGGRGEGYLKLSCISISVFFLTLFFNN